MYNTAPIQGMFNLSMDKQAARRLGGRIAVIAAASATRQFHTIYLISPLKGDCHTVSNLPTVAHLK